MAVLLGAALHRDEWLDLVPTTGGFTRHPEAIQTELLDGLGAAVDAAGGTFTMSYDDDRRHRRPAGLLADRGFHGPPDRPVAEPGKRA